MSNYKYLGEEASFWQELKYKSDVLGVTDYIREIAKLRGKLDFYESRIKQMNDLMVKE